MGEREPRERETATEETEVQHAKKRKPGPVPGEPTRKYNVMIEEGLAEWAKAQPEGLSALVRRLLKVERERHSGA